MKFFAAIAACCLLVMFGCSSPEAWGDALDETAPPNPNRAHAQNRDTQSEVDSTPTRQTQKPVNPVETQAPKQRESGEQPTSITATLEGYPSCHSGAVRFYVNRRYKGQFDDEGKITTEVSPGELTLEVWDSSGHWLKRVNISEGQTLDVTFSCGEKNQISEGNATGSNSSSH